MAQFKIPIYKVFVMNDETYKYLVDVIYENSVGEGGGGRSGRAAGDRIDN
jgi:hypothetical protein